MRSTCQATQPNQNKVGQVPGRFDWASSSSIVDPGLALTVVPQWIGPGRRSEFSQNWANACKHHKDRWSGGNIMYLMAWLYCPRKPTGELSTKYLSPNVQLDLQPTTKSPRNSSAVRCNLRLTWHSWGHDCQFTFHGNAPRVSTCGQVLNLISDWLELTRVCHCHCLGVCECVPHAALRQIAAAACGWPEEGGGGEWKRNLAPGEEKQM